MPRYAEIRDGFVAQIIELPEGVAISDAVHAEVIDAFREAPARVEAGWSFDGKKFVEIDRKPDPGITAD